MSNKTESHPLTFFRTGEQSCAYIPEQRSSNVLADPEWPMDAGAYAVLLANGFRRSGEHVYRPSCPACEACVPVRVVVADFVASRNQRRTLARNQDVEHRIVAAVDSDEHYALYERYLKSRHGDSEMAQTDRGAFTQFLTGSWCETVFIEFRLDGVLVAVAVTDRVPDGLSSVYTFFDPDFPKRSLGRLAILRQLAVAAEHGIRYLYLGYTIEACQNMAYKSEYAPQQRFKRGVWHAAD